MKKFKFNILFIVWVAVLVSCDDMLDFYPELDRNDYNTWTTPEAFAKGANNFYTWLPYIQDRGGIEGIAGRDGKADLVAGKGNTISNSTYSQKSSEAVYTNYYSHLRSINYLLKNAEEVYLGAQEDLAQYVAEAHFFRAYESFIFFRDFGPGTIVKKVLDANSIEVTGSRASRNDFVDFMIEDLEAAINGGALPTQSTIRGTETDGRVTSGAANALLARICLFEGTWQKYHNEMDESQGTTVAERTERSNYLLQKGKIAAEAVIADNSYKLFRNADLGDASYKYMFVLQNTIATNPAGVLKAANEEYIFRNRFHDVNKVFNQNVIHTYRTSGITKQLVDVFETVDGSPKDYSNSISFDGWSKNRDPRLKELAIPYMSYYWDYSSSRKDFSTTDGYTVLNGTGFSFTINKWSIEFEYSNLNAAFDVPIIRLGGLYLDYAEILCELNGDNSINVNADEHINLVRQRAGIFTKPTWTLEEIRNERMRELFLEGYRLDDVRRWAKGPELLGRDLLGQFIGTYNSPATAGENNMINAWAATPKIMPAKVDMPYYKWVRLQRTSSAFPNAYAWVFYDTRKATPTYVQIIVPTANNSVYYTRDNLNTTTSPNTTIDENGYYIVEGASERVFPLRMYMLPLPREELTLNPNLKQNPYWEAIEE